MKLIKHETCQEYFNRRLSEGWKCISIDGYNAVLLSPDSIRRKVDLRNDVLTLRPNAGGNHTGLKYYDGSEHNPDSGENYKQVDEANTDEDSTYVYTDAAHTSHYDLYGIPNITTELGKINSVQLYNRVKRSDDFPPPTVFACIRTHGTYYESANLGPTTGWSTLSKTWTDNPYTSLDWIPYEIDDLEIGCNLELIDGWIYCTQAYVEVDYSKIIGPFPTHFNV